MIWLIGPILGAVVGIFVAWVWTSLRRGGSKVYQALAPVSLRSGIDALFSASGTGSASLVIFELTMRPHFPLLDLLYLEKLRLMLREDSARIAVVGVWASPNDWPDEVFAEYSASIRRYLGVDVAARCDIVNVATLTDVVAIDDEFLNLLAFVSSDDSLAEASKSLGVNVKSPCDLNPGRDGGEAMRSLVVHVLRSVVVAQYLEDSIPRSEGNQADPLEDVCLLIWELELDKLALVASLRSAGRLKRYGAIGGKTLAYGDRLRRRPLPAKDGAFGVRDVEDPERFQKSIAALPRGAAKRYAGVSRLLVESRDGSKEARPLAVPKTSRSAAKGRAGELEDDMRVLLAYL